MALEREQLEVRIPHLHLVPHGAHLDTGIHLKGALKARFDSLEQQAVKHGFMWVNPNSPDVYHIRAVVSKEEKQYLINIDYRSRTGEREILIQDYGKPTPSQPVILIGTDGVDFRKGGIFQKLGYRAELSLIQKVTSALVDKTATRQEYANNLVVNRALRLKTNHKVDCNIPQASQLILIK